MVTAGGHNSEAVESLALIEAITDDNIDTFVEVRHCLLCFHCLRDEDAACALWFHCLRA